jgi:hypothetical protein
MDENIPIVLRQKPPDDGFLLKISLSFFCIGSP